MSKYINVRGHSGLVRDKGSGAILNINNSEISQARKRKKAWKLEQQQREKVAKEVSDLKQDVNEIKTLLKQILEVNNGDHNG